MPPWSPLKLSDFRGQTARAFKRDHSHHTHLETTDLAAVTMAQSLPALAATCPHARIQSLNNEQYTEKTHPAAFYGLRRLDTPTVRPRRPVVFVCWPRTRRPA